MFHLFTKIDSISTSELEQKLKETDSTARCTNTV